MKIIKAKVKLHLVDENWNKHLEIKLKVQGEIAYWHSKVVVGTKDKSDDQFYAEVIKFVSDIKNTEMAGENFLREIIENNAKLLITQSKEKQAKALLKELSRPINIEVKG